jgi:hypothetical protein
MDPAFSLEEPLTMNDDDWSHYADTDEVVVGSSMLVEPCYNGPLEMPSCPPQLHPAVSLGVQRVSSCYFSLGSEESVADLLSQFGDEHEEDSTTSKQLLVLDHQSADVLYHDILMHVFTFLDAQSLASFSETARRPNFEVFYFLQLQLQRALLFVDPSFPDTRTKTHPEEDETKKEEAQNIHHHQDHYLSAIAGVSCLSRLTRLDLPQAQATVDDYLQSNSTLRTMPLSHSLAYMRHVLRRHGFHNHYLLAAQNSKGASPSHALASAALLVTVVGAASLMTGDTAAAFDSFGSELPNMLFRFGCVGSLMGAAKMSADTEQRASMRETAEHMARTMQELPSALLHRSDTTSNHHFRLPSLVEMKQRLRATLGNQMSRRDSQPMLSDPYDHLPRIEEKKVEEKKEEEEESEQRQQLESHNRKMPSGCVGAYSRAIEKAGTCVTQIVKERRNVTFLALTQDEQRQVTLTFLDACTSDDSLSLVKQMIHTIDVDGFYMGSDEAETCALHTAAFHGAAQVLDFLCQGIDDSDPQGDGGLCDVNGRDNNGWTALHFAAGANSVAAAQVLARHGAKLAVEANNGYTPLQWALRLSNEAVAEELKNLTKNGTDQAGWMPSRPLATIANRFFSLIPSH